MTIASAARGVSAARRVVRPAPALLAGHMNFCERGAARAIMTEYDRRTDEALAVITGMLDPECGAALLATLAQHAESATSNWQRLFAASDSPSAHDDSAQQDDTPPADRALRRPRRPGAAPNIVPNDEDGNTEHPENGHRPGSLHVQRTIMAAVDARRSAALRSTLAAQGSSSDVRL